MRHRAFTTLNVMASDQPRYPPAAVIVGASVAFGLVATLLIYRQAPGAGIALTAMLGLALLLALGSAVGARLPAANAWLPVALLVFAAMVAVRANLVLLLVNCLAIVGLGSVLLASYRGPPVHRLALGDLVWAQVLTWLNLAFRPFAVVVAAAHATEWTRASRAAFPVARGLLLAVPLLCVFTALFVSADRVFAGYVGEVFAQLSLADLIRQLFFVAAFGWLAMAALDLAVGPAERDPLRAVLSKLGSPAITRPRLGFTEAVVAIVLVDLLFVAFVVVQLQYLFLGPESLALRGGVISHAEYAREGFFQLLVAAFLTLASIWTLERLTRRDRPTQHFVFNALATVMVACAVVMLASSFRRLYLYELEFGFTQDRLFPHAVTIWLGAVFVFFLIALWTGRERMFSAGLLGACVAFVVGLNAINPDAFTVARNIERLTVYGKPLDVAYLGRTSTDAIPTLVALLDRLPPAEQEQLTTILRRKQAALAREEFDWRSANLSVIQARQALDARFGPIASD
jgi:hypothetical protein